MLRLGHFVISAILILAFESPEDDRKALMLP